MFIELNTINLLNILLLLGVLQGLIVFFLLLWKKPATTANKVLAFWILILALANWHIIFQTSNLYQLFGQRFTLFAPISLNLFFGPLIWLFCRKITEVEFEIKGKVWWHLLPGTAEFFYYLLYLQLHCTS